MTLDTSRPFRLKDALAAGLSRNALAGPRFRRLLPGIYIAAAATLDALTWCRAVLLAAGRAAFVSHHDAALLYRAVVPHSPTRHASVPAGRFRSQREGVTVHRSSRTPVTFRSIPVTSPEDTFLDLSSCLDLVDLVVLGDSLVKRGRTNPRSLLEASNKRGTRKAVRAAELVRREVDSPMETRLRLLIVLAGLPEPEVNIVFRDEDGALSRRLDMGYSEGKLGIEYDGRHHREVGRQWEADVLRREEFDGAQWRLITLIASDLYQKPGATLARIVAAMKGQGLRPGALDDEWRAHFPETGHSRA